MSNLDPPPTSSSRFRNSNVIAKSGDVEFRIPTAAYNLTQPCFPDFCIPSVICPGIMKSGTTTLALELMKHPKIATSTDKELNHYVYVMTREGEHIIPPLDDYKKFFNEAEARNKIRIDVSPKYMTFPESAELIYKTNPSAKFIILFRDPVSRTYSQFQYFEKIFLHHNESKCTKADRLAITFEMALAREFEILSSCGLINWEIDFEFVCI